MRALVLAALAAVPFAAGPAAQTFQTAAAPVGPVLSARPDRAPEAADLAFRGGAAGPTPDCYGSFDASAPDAVVDWPGGALWMTVRSRIDATLAVYGPDGQWACNDDGDGLAPVVELGAAPRGRYAVWIGTFDPDPAFGATFYAGTRPAVTAPDLRPQPAAEDVRTGDLQSDLDVVVTETEARGLQSVESLPIQGADGAFCSGFIDPSRATLRIDNGGGTASRLLVGANSEEVDTVLLVHTPDGRWLCDDDSGAGLNATVAVPEAAAGVYTVWLGSFSGMARTDAAAATVTVSTAEYVDPDMGDGEDFRFEPTPFSEGEYRPLDLAARPATRLALGAAEAAAEAAASIRPDGQNPVFGPTCVGRIQAAPTAAVTLAGDGPVALTATGDLDLVLVVQTPGGTWYCSDDADGLDPGVQIDAPEAGTYRVWVGTFADLDQDAAVTVRATRGELVVSTPDGMGMDETGGMPQSDGLYDGQDLRPDAAAQTTLGSPESQSVTVLPSLLNPVAGEACAGFVEAAPTATTTAAGTLYVTAWSPAADLVLVVRSADGQWYCSDDAEGSNPAVTFVTGAGTSSIWVGTFSRPDAPVEASLAIDE